MTTNGLRRVIEFLVEILQFLFHQQAHGRFRDKLGDAGGAGVRAMRGAEGIVHIKIAEFCQRFGKFGIVRFFLRMETKILEQRHVALLHVRDNFFRHLADGVVTENDRMIDQGVQIISHRSQRILVDSVCLSAGRSATSKSFSRRARADN